VQLVHSAVGSASASERSLLHRVFRRIEQLEQVSRSKALQVLKVLQVLRTSALGRRATRLHLLTPQLVRVDNSVMVTFSGIGQPQVIRVPAGATTSLQRGGDA
jgi:hypothetical protein